MAFILHLLIGFIIRLSLIAYSDYHDRYYDVQYTDVDYKVFTDAARHIIEGNSPYKRHTYRYSPLIAYFMIPNYLYEHFGKVLFSIFDILISIAIKKVVSYQLKGYKLKYVDEISQINALFWLYNPLSIAISTRGNADSVPCLFIILSLMFLQSTKKSHLSICLSGILLGISIHLRLYPLVFSFPMYLCLGNFNITKNTSIKNGLAILMPNKKQLLLTLSCILTLLILTFSFYILYGYEFLFESYIYHLFRKDTRHSFSVLFYHSYLSVDQFGFDYLKCFNQLLVFLILFILSLTFGCDLKTLPFGLFCQAFVIVAYNSVLTSQYFIWFLSLLPLVLHNLQISIGRGILLAVLWFSSQGSWLYYAYMLEFKGQKVFSHIWLQGLLFFLCNIYVLATLIKSYSTSLNPKLLVWMQQKERRLKSE